MARVIQSPGVEINEIDLSSRTTFPTGTNILIQGFAPQGPTDETLFVSTMSEFETIYGAPTNAAERYFYHTVKSTFNSPANIMVSRLPYGEKRGTTFSDELYSALILPVSGNDHETSLSSLSGSQLQSKKVVFSKLASGSTGLTAGASTISVENSLVFKAGDNILLEDANNNESVVIDTIDTANHSITLTGNISNNYAKTVVVVVKDGDGDGTSKLSNVSDCTELMFGVPQRIDLLTEEYIALKNGEVQFDDDCVLPFNSDGTINRRDATVTGANQSNALNFDDLPAYFTRGISQDADYELVDASGLPSAAGSIVEGVSKRKIAIFKERLAKCGMMLVNKAQSTMNTYYEGYYVAFGDNGQFAIDDGSDLANSKFKAVEGLKTFGQSGQYYDLPQQRLNFDMTAHTVTGSQGSMSEVFENVPSFDIAVDSFKDTIGLAVFKLRKSIYATETTALDFILDESHVGSMDAYRQQASINGGKAKSFYIETVDANSTLLSVFANKKISEESGTFLTQQGDLVDVPNTTIKFHDSAQKYAWGTGTYQEETPGSSKKSIGTVVDKIERNFEKLQNLDEYDLDITLDAGLTTINTYVQYQQALADDADGPVAFDDEVVVDITGMFGSEIGASTGAAAGTSSNTDEQEWDGNAVVNSWKAVANSFIVFAQDRRKDHMTILDPLRYIFVSGRNGITTKDQTKNFSQHLLYPLKHLLGTVNSNYCAVYGNWLKQYDSGVDKNFWAPPSGVIGAAYANNDATYDPWFAPAGFTRGLITNALEVAIRPNQKQRDQFYKLGLNPIAYFPGDGYVIFGQKTMQAKPSAFDRINVRRMFLWTEKAVRQTIKYYVFEPNTFKTRQSVLAVLTPIFTRVKANQGLYDFLIVCDERNNPPVVIDNNELVVDIYIKPVRAAEFILVNFYATRTDQNFGELIG